MAIGLLRAERSPSLGPFLFKVCVSVEAVSVGRQKTFSLVRRHLLVGNGLVCGSLNVRKQLFGLEVHIAQNL